MIEIIGSLGAVVLIVIPLVVLPLSLYWRRRQRNQKLERLRHKWGRVPDRTLDIEDAGMFFDLDRSGFAEHSYCLDDDTWRDLDLDEIFALIDRTTTPTGAQGLFHLLRHPTDNKEILDERERLIDCFSINHNPREEVQLALWGLRGMSVRNIPHLLWQPLPEKPAWAKYIPGLSLVAMIVLGLVLLNVLHVGVLVGLFFVNFVIRVFVKRKIDIFIHSFEQLGDLIGCANKLSLLNCDQIRAIQDSLKANLKNTKKIEKLVLAVQYNDSMALMDYINSYFLFDVSGFYSALNMVRQHVDELRNLYRTVGHLDAMVAIASFRSEYVSHCRPSFNADSSLYRVNDIYNPLLQTPVPNSFRFDGPNYIVTGSNMAGKTTFIKTMGVNAILAQTINTCLATKYEAPLIRVISSIGPEDNLLLGKSYFMAEVESIHRLIGASESNLVHLFIMDEIFRGTNSVERDAMSVEVLKYLANGKDFVLVATHDMELCKMLKGEYQNIHFQEEIDDDGLTFDYILRPGSSTTRNAIALLQHVGYPECITAKAINRIHDDGA